MQGAGRRRAWFADQQPHADDEAGDGEEEGEDDPCAADRGVSWRNGVLGLVCEQKQGNARAAWVVAQEFVVGAKASFVVLAAPTPTNHVGSGGAVPLDHSANDLDPFAAQGVCVVEGPPGEEQEADRQRAEHAANATAHQLVTRAASRTPSAVSATRSGSKEDRQRRTRSGRRQTRAQQGAQDVSPARTATGASPGSPTGPVRNGLAAG